MSTMVSRCECFGLLDRSVNGRVLRQGFVSLVGREEDSGHGTSDAYFFVKAEYHKKKTVYLDSKLNVCEPGGTGDGDGSICQGETLSAKE